MRFIIALALASTGCGQGTVIYGGVLTNLLTGDPIEGGEVCVTDPAEVGCATTDATGYASLEAPANMDAFDLRIEAEGYFTTISYGSTTDTDNTDIGITLLSTGSTDLLELTAGITVDPTKGFLSFYPKNPAGGLATGVTVSLSPSSGEVFYLDDSATPVPDATSTAGGVAAFANVDPGVITITAPAACTSLFSYADFAGSQEIVVEANAVTFFGLECPDM